MKAERARKGMTASEVAEIIGVHVNALLRWENDEAEPMAGKSAPVAKPHACPPEYLLESDERKAG